MRIEVDVSDVHAVTERARHELGNVGRRMLNSAKLGAEYERRNHEYRNRTGRLERSTAGVLERDSSAEAAVSLEMTMPYASFVQNRGLSEVAHAAHIVEEQIAEEFEAIGHKIAGR